MRLLLVEDNEELTSLFIDGLKAADSREIECDRSLSPPAPKHVGGCWSEYCHSYGPWRWLYYS